MTGGMHVLAFEEKPTQFAGGQERSLFEALQYFAGAGAKVSLCYRSEGELLSQYRAFVHDAFCVASRIVRKPYAAFVRDLASMWAKGQAERWTVLYANQYFDTPIATSLGLLTGIPVVCHLRLPAPQSLSRQYRWGLLRCARLIAISNSAKGSYVREGIPEDRISVVHNGIDTSAFRPRPAQFDVAPQRPRRLAYFGRICPLKGLETLLRAFAQLQEEQRSLELHIYGNVLSAQVGSGYLDTLKTLAGPRFGRTVFFHPHVPDIRDALAQTDLVVLPSTWEAFGRVLIEAMASGVPVVACNAGGIPEILAPRFSDHMVPVGDAQALAAAIARLADWRECRPELGSECRRWVEARFSHQERLQDVLSIIRQTARAH